MNKAQPPWSCDCAHPAALQKEMQMGYVFDRASGDSKMSPFSPELEASTYAAMAVNHFAKHEPFLGFSDPATRTPAAGGGCGEANDAGVPAVERNRTTRNRLSLARAPRLCTSAGDR